MNSGACASLSQLLSNDIRPLLEIFSKTLQYSQKEQIDLSESD